jgi:hypothetical protein
MLFGFLTGSGMQIWASWSLFERILYYQGPFCKYSGTALQILYSHRGIYEKVVYLFIIWGFWAFRLISGLWDRILGSEICTEVIWVLRFVFGLWDLCLGFEICTQIIDLQLWALGFHQNSCIELLGYDIRGPSDKDSFGSREQILVIRLL